ncbi:multicopy suppressor of sta proteins [Zygosaccharomyces mellis]|uniref:Multicopy suppressor of sta proteins n=1 Tax=Zygosaccharomyces mellis TaxID=42258 RepID=A0A4C2E1U6_9SACH|nr:multicopy suppressor of sta proteins [Zygosaccharomyces mellis]
MVQKERKKFDMNSNIDLGTCTTVVSDSNARDPKQLLHAHVYNYLIKNGHYATARQFLQEADLPLCSRNPNEITSTEITNNTSIDTYTQRLPPDLLATNLQGDSEETLLFEWWNTFCKLRSHVEQTPLEELRTDPSNIPTPFLPTDKDSSAENQQDILLEKSDSI